MLDSTRWILDGLPFGVWVARVPGGEVEYANQAFSEILGVAAVPQSRITDAPTTYGIFNRQGAIYPPDKLPFSRVLASGQAQVVDDIVIHRPDGTRVNVRAFGRPIRNAAGTITHVIVAFNDVTREVEALEQRDAIADRLGFVVDHAPIAIFAIDSAGTITLSAGAGLRVLGVRPGELVGRSIFELYGSHPEIPAYIRRALAGDSFWYTVSVGDATFETWIAPRRDPSGKLAGAIGLSHDVSEMRRLQRVALQNDRLNAMGLLAAGVAHEVNNPLTYVIGHLEALAARFARMGRPRTLHPGHPDDELWQEVEACLQPALEGAHRIAHVTRQLRTFGRPHESAPTAIDLRDAVDSALTLVGKILRARTTLEVDVPPRHYVLGNISDLVQVVMNLLLNAVQALPEDEPGASRIILSAHHRDDAVVLEVCDTGRGVPPELRDRIFDPFFSTKDIGVGTGLGLFVCRNIVRGLGGELSLVPGPLSGACFRVSLPPALGQTETSDKRAPGPEGSAPRPAGGACVLVIDDDPLVGDSLASQLRARGHVVAVVASGEEALARLTGPEAFDLVYCDLMMNGLSGMDLSRKLEAERPDLAARVVYMTGGAFTPEAERFVAGHPSVVVAKPFDIVAETRARLSQAAADAQRPSS